MRKIFSAYASSLLGVASGLLTNLWLIRAVTREVPTAQFGVYALMLQVTGYLAILQLSLDFAASQRIAVALGQNDFAAANRCYWALARTSRWGVMVALALTAVLSAGLDAGIGVSAETARLAALLCLFTGANQAVLFLTRRGSAALIGSQRQTTVNLLTVAGTVSTTVSAYGLLRLGLGIACLPVAQLAVSTLVAVAMGRLAARCAWRTRAPLDDDATALRDLLRFGGLTEIGGVAWTVEATCDVVLLGALRGTGDVAVYALWWRFPNMCFDICARLAFSSFPGFAERHGRSADDAARLFSRVAPLTLALATTALLGIGLWLPGFVGLWLGPAYARPDGVGLAALMAILVCLRALGNLLSLFWIARGDAALTTRLQVVQAVLKLVLAALLIHKLGMVGGVVASIMSAAIQVIGVGTALRARRWLPGRLPVLALVLLGIAVAVVNAIGPRVVHVSVPELAAGIAATVIGWGIVYTLVFRRAASGVLASLVRRHD